MSRRWGLTVPLIGVPLPEHAAIVRALPDLGYTDVWSAETNGTDAFTPLALAAAWEPTLRLGTAIVPVYTRGPALIAMSAASLAAAAPGRFVLGLGASSPVIVGNWNGIAFEQPFQRSRDVLRVVRSALAGERVDGTFDTFAVNRFKLEQAPSPPPPIVLAALRPQMLRLAGREADGAILNWLASTDVPRCTAAIGNPDAEVVARIFVCPTDDAEFARNVGRLLISTYLTVPAYAAFHDWLGRGDVLRPMHEAWAAGDRKGAAAAIPDEVVDALVVHGRPEQCRDRVEAYVAAGVGTPVMALLPTPAGPPTLDLLRALGRS
jgi:probable F420-dependent oxidoreductase